MTDDFQPVTVETIATVPMPAHMSDSDVAEAYTGMALLKLTMADPLADCWHKVWDAVEAAEAALAEDTEERYAEHTMALALIIARRCWHTGLRGTETMKPPVVQKKVLDRVVEQLLAHASTTGGDNLGRI